MADIYSLQFDEVSSYLSSAADSDWEMIRASGSKAYLFWVNVADNSGAAFQYYYSTGSVSSSGALNFYINESTNTVTARPEVSAMGVTSGALSFPTGWILVSHQYNRDTFMWELAMTPEGGSTTRVSSANTLTNNQTLNAPDIGRRKDGNVDRYYGGKVGSITVTPYNTLLSDVQLESLAASFIDYDPTTEFTPVLHFPFNEGSGSTVTDTVKGLVLNGTSVSAGWTLEGSTGGNESLIVDSGSYSINGADINLTAQLSITTTSGGYLLTGSQLSLIAARKSLVDSGSYTLTGTDVTLTYAPGGGGDVLIIDSGIYSLAGDEVVLRADLSLIANSDNYQLHGSNTPILFKGSISASPSNYSITGASLNTFANYGMIAQSASYSLTGVSVTLKYSGDISQAIGVVTAGFAGSLYGATFEADMITVNFKGK